MADDKNTVPIKITTEADLKGIEKTDAAIKDLEATEKKANAEARAAAQAETAVNDREANLRGRAVAMVKLGETIRQYGAAAKNSAGDIAGLDKQTQQLVGKIGEVAEAAGGMVSSVSQAFAAGGPLAAVITAATKGFAMFLTEYGKAGKALDDFDKAGARAKTTWERLQDLKKKLPIVEVLENVNKLLDLELEKLIRNERVRDADRKAAAAEASEAGAAGLADGSKTAGEVKAAALIQDLTRQRDEILERQRTAAVAQAKLQSDVDTLRAQASLMLDTDGQKAETLAKADELQKAANKGLADLQAEMQVTASLLRELDAKASGGVREVASEFQKNLTTDLNSAFQAVEATNAQGRAAKEAIQQASSDGKLTAEEARKVAESTRTLIGQVQSGQAQYSGNIQALIDLQREANEMAQGHSRQIAELRNAVAALKAETEQRLRSLGGN